MHVNIEQTVMIFLNGRSNRPADGGPRQIVAYDKKANRWVTYKPNKHDIDLICFTADLWYRNRNNKKQLKPTEAPATV